MPISATCCFVFSFQFPPSLQIQLSLSLCLFYRFISSFFTLKSVTIITWKERGSSNEVADVWR